MYTRPKLTKLQVSGVVFPAGSDKEIRVSVSRISGASDVRRTVNGEPYNLGRAGFVKHAISIAGDDMHPPGIVEFWPGAYVEVILPEPFALSYAGGATICRLERAATAVIGITLDGRKIAPIAQPQSWLPLSTGRTTQRIANLRLRPTVNFSEPVSLVRCRPVIPCIVISTTWDSDERMAASSWSMQLEEI